MSMYHEVGHRFNEEWLKTISRYWMKVEQAARVRRKGQRTLGEIERRGVRNTRSDDGRRSDDSRQSLDFSGDEMEEDELLR